MSDYDLTHYYQGERSEMLEFIPADAKRILEVGCGEGGFSAFLKEKLGAEIWGIEINETAGKKAEKIFHKLFIGDAFSLLGELPDQYFDCIIFNDVIEHMVDPYSLLYKIKSKLSKTGVIASSIPNVRHYNTLFSLVFKKQWRYEDAGVLDRTHLRFFTGKSIREMFDEQGYDIIKMKGLNRSTHRTINIVNILSLGWLSDTLYLQYGCQVRPR